MDSGVVQNNAPPPLPECEKGPYSPLSHRCSLTFGLKGPHYRLELWAALHRRGLMGMRYAPAHAFRPSEGPSYGELNEYSTTWAFR